MGVASIFMSVRQGGNYTQPDPMPRPDPTKRYIAYVAYIEVGRYPSHQEAEQRVKQEFLGLNMLLIDATMDATNEYWRYI
jgi:hypothetical protein